MDEVDVDFEEWKNTVPQSIRSEKFWPLIAYQKALYLYDLLWQDTQGWLRDVRGQSLARQVIASADSVCSNIEEGYGRGFGRQLLQFYGYALGSARETKGHIYRGKRLMPESTLQKRLGLASEAIALLLAELNRQKYRT